MSHVFYNFFTYDFGGEEPDSARIKRAKFQTVHTRDRCAIGKESDIVEG